MKNKKNKSKKKRKNKKQRAANRKQRASGRKQKSKSRKQKAKRNSTSRDSNKSKEALDSAKGKSSDPVQDKKGKKNSKKEKSEASKLEKKESQEQKTEKVKKTGVKGLFSRVSSFYNTKVRPDKRYQIFSKIFSIILFLVGLYLVVYPFVPAILYKLFQEGKEVYPYQTELEEEVSGEGAEFGDKGIPEENRLVIPSIGVDMAIIEGDDESALNLGVWHRPGTGYPTSGNMVLTGHRVGYAFLPEDVKASTSFYNLDKVKVGDYIIVYWDQTEYDYEVYSYEVVDKTAISIESQDTGERLTLYTCHPVGQNDKRLVYYAKRIETGDKDQSIEDSEVEGE
jgi:LPXTG-site transpeptidase (sortase) family protein